MGPSHCPGSMLEQELLRVQHGPADVFQCQAALVGGDARDVLLRGLQLTRWGRETAAK